jgi:hypothetical protein
VVEDQVLDRRANLNFHYAFIDIGIEDGAVFSTALSASNP